MVIRLALKDLYRNKSFVFAFILNLAIGLSGFVIVDSIKGSLIQESLGKAKSMLGADLAIRGRREISDQELKKVRALLGQSYKEAETWEFYTMARSAKANRLIHVKALGVGFPFYGAMELEGAGFYSGGSSLPLEGKNHAWAAEDILVQFGIAEGDELKVGDLNFEIRDRVNPESLGVTRGFNFAPSLVIALSQIKKSEMISKGSTITYTRFFKTENPIDKKAIESIFDDASIDILTPENANEQMTRLTAYLTDFLAIAGLSALALSIVGLGFLLRSFFVRKIKEVGILTSLGMRREQTLTIYWMEIVICALFGLMIASGFAYALLPIFKTVIKNVPGAFLPTVTINLRAIVITGGISILLSTLLSWPLLQALRVAKVQSLFGGNSIEIKTSWFDSAKMGTLLLGVFYGLSVWQSRSFKIGSTFFFALIGVALIILILAYFFNKSINQIKTRNWTFKHALLRISRKPDQSVIIFVALGLASLIYNLMPQIRYGIAQEIRSDRSNLPGLFMFDVQDEQIGGVRTLLEEEGVKVQSELPMVRARVSLVNNVPFEKSTESGSFTTREDEEEARFRNRGFNLTYKDDDLLKSQIVQGRPFASKIGDVAEISVEERFADRLGIKIGDSLEFDIQSIPLQTKVVSLRKVQWTSFQPNFFIVVQPGFLEEAPKSWILATAPLDAIDKIRVQNSIVDRFANISMVDVKSTAERILDMVDQILFAIRLMTLLSLFAALVVIVAIQIESISQRLAEYNLMKVLGADVRALAHLTFIEAATGSFVAIIVGSILAVVPSLIIGQMIFRVFIEIDWFQIISGAGSVWIIATLTGVFMGSRAFFNPPIAILKAEQ